MSTLQPHFADQPPANRRQALVVLGSSLWPGRLYGLLFLSVGVYIGYKVVHGRALAAWMESSWYFIVPAAAALLGVFMYGYRAVFGRHSLAINPSRGRWILRTGIFPFFRRREGNMEEIGGVVLGRDEVRRDDSTVSIFAIDIEWRQPAPEPFRVQQFDVEIWRSGSFRLRSRGESGLPAARARAMEIARLTGLPLHDEIADEEVRPARPPDIESALSLGDTISDGAEADVEVVLSQPEEDSSPATEVVMAVPGASILRLLRPWFMGYAGIAIFVGMPLFGPSFLSSDHPPINWDAAKPLAVFVFSIVTLVLICRHVPLAASTLIRIGNGRFHGQRRWLLVKFRRTEYPLDFVRRVRVDGGRIEVEFTPPPETSIYPSVRPVPRFWYFAHGLPVEEQHAIAERLRSTVATVLAADPKRKS